MAEPLHTKAATWGTVPLTVDVLIASFEALMDELDVWAEDRSADVRPSALMPAGDLLVMDANANPDSLRHHAPPAALANWPRYMVVGTADTLAKARLRVGRCDLPPAFILALRRQREAKANG